MDLDHLRLADMLFYKISTMLSYGNLAPEGLGEHEQLFSVQKKDPCFTYCFATQLLEEYREKLSDLEFGDSPIEQLYCKKKDELLVKISLFENLGTSEFTTDSLKLFAAPTKQLITQANALLELNPVKATLPVYKKDGIKIIEQFLSEMNFLWKVEQVDMVTRARVQNLKRELHIKQGTRFTEHFLKKMLIHEIGTHALRTENGSQQSYGIFHYGTADYGPTEEGLAVYHEYISGLLTNADLRHYAGRVIAIDHALSHSFSDTYEMLTQYFDHKTAYNLALRVKRGLSDTSEPGAFTKDSMYLRGFLNVKSFAKENNISDLYVGKVGLGDLEIIKDLALEDPKYTFEQFTDHDLFKKSAGGVDRQQVDSLLETTDLNRFF